MKKILFILTISLFSTIWCFAQKVDTVINEGIYTSYYSYQLKEPLYVVYDLYKGGGDCSRTAFHFTTIGLPSEATQKDYKASGYDEGHLCNAKDFAGDCAKEQITFHFINCLPQTPRLNRGIWKHYETRIRILSQLKHLKVICGGIFDSTHFIGNGVAVPTYCWKLVLTNDNEVVFCLLFPNDNSDTVQELSIDELKNKLDYDIKY